MIIDFVRFLNEKVDKIFFRNTGFLLPQHYHKEMNNFFYISPYSLTNYSVSRTQIKYSIFVPKPNRITFLNDIS